MEIRDLCSNSDKHCLISPLQHNNGTRDNLFVIATKPGKTIRSVQLWFDNQMPKLPKKYAKQSTVLHFAL